MGYSQLFKLPNTSLQAVINITATTQYLEFVGTIDVTGFSINKYDYSGNNPLPQFNTTTKRITFGATGKVWNISIKNSSGVEVMFLPCQEGSGNDFLNRTVYNQYANNKIDHFLLSTTGLWSTAYRNDIYENYYSLKTALGLTGELVTNGTFDSSVSGWTFGAGCSISYYSGSAKLTANNPNPYVAYPYYYQQAGYAFHIYRYTYSVKFVGHTGLTIDNFFSCLGIGGIGYCYSTGYSQYAKLPLFVNTIGVTALTTDYVGDGQIFVSIGGNLTINGYIIIDNVSLKIYEDNVRIPYSKTVSGKDCLGYTLTHGNSLIAHYPFNGNANDISGNNYHGTVVGTTPTTNRFGIVNSAYSFDGVDDYITLPAQSIVAYNGTFSISIWFKQAISNTTFSYLFDARTTKEKGFCITSKNISFQNGLGGGQSITYFAINNYKYNNIIVIYNNNNVYVYLNSKFIKNLNITTNWGTTVSIILGRNFLLATSATYKACHEDDIRIYNRVLSNSEIKALYRERPETSYFAEFAQANGYQVTTSGNITGWLINELNGCRVEQLGSATLSIVDNSHISYTSGTLFGIKIYDSSDNLIHELPCCENNVNVPYLHCSVTGRIFYITNVKTIVKQDIYFKCQDNGWQRVTITESGDVMDVAYKNDKTKIYN